jgi:hypothetical protein
MNINNISNQDINDSISKINTLIQQSTDSLLCNTECQQKRKADELKEKYVKAQENLKTAPNKIMETEKNYYVFVNGENEYNEHIEEELKMKAEDIFTNLYLKEFKEQKEKNQLLLDEIQLIINNASNTNDLYKDYRIDNRYIKRKLKDYQSQSFTNFRKTYYQIENQESVIYKYKFYYRFYYIFLCIYLVLLVVFGVRPQKVSIKNFIIISIFFILYPIFIYHVIKYLVMFYNWCISIKEFIFHNAL